jgi:hypothetical protein
MGRIRKLAWWRGLRWRWKAPRVARDPNDMGDMGTAFGLDACLQANEEFSAFQESQRLIASAAPTKLTGRDRLNGRSVL